MAARTNDPFIRRVMAATDRSETADRAARYAAHLAAPHGAELLLFQVLPPPGGAAAPPGAREGAAADSGEALRRFAAELAGTLGRARLVEAADPAQAILDAAAEERADVLVVGNVGMGGRKQFLLGNIPNRISHNARCTVIIVNTAGEGQRGSGGPRDAGRDEAAPSEGMLLARAWRIGRVLAKAGIRDLLAHPQASDPGAARRLRTALDQLGPTFAKIGQILSTRPDLIPAALREELATLQDRVTPLGEAEVVAAMERELGVPWEDVFESIDPAPLAAGTIAQVHRATLESGERVVVKIQRPTAEGDILLDLGLLEVFARKAAGRPALRRVIDLPAVVEQLSASLRRELDFRGEAANLRRMREILAPYPRLDVPLVYERYSTARLLVMEEIGGVPVRDAPAGRARTESARQLLEGYYHQIMGEGFFHADPHPGNMKWWNDKIYFLDLGMVGELDAGTRELVLLLLLAFAQKDAPFLAEVVLMLAGRDGKGAGVDAGAFRADLEGVIARYRDLAISELRIGPLLQDVSQIAMRHRIRVPAALALAAKAVIQMQDVAAQLDPTIDPFAVAEAYVLRGTVRRLLGGLDLRRGFYEAQKARIRIGRTLEGVEALVGARPGAGSPLDPQGLERLEGTIRRTGRQVSLTFGLSGALVVTAIASDSARIPRWVPALSGGIGGILSAALLLDRVRGRGTGSPR